MLLAIDIGNSNITLGIFNDENIIKILRMDTNIEYSQEIYLQKFNSLLQEFNITKCVIASVVHKLDEKIKNAIDKIFKINSKIIDINDKLGINIKTNNPQKTGIDRIVNASWAYLNYKKSAIVVDIGTAITIDIVNSKGDFIGGIIKPGLNLQLKSLNTTSKLPKIEINKIENAIGTNTNNAILSGVILGTAFAIKGLINQCKKELNENPIIIATGGNSKIISKYIPKTFDIINPNLTLEGLKIIYEINTLNS